MWVDGSGMDGMMAGSIEMEFYTYLLHESVRQRVEI